MLPKPITPTAFPCSKVVLWEAKPNVGQPATLTFDVTSPNNSKIELKVTHFISRGNVVEMKPEKLVYAPAVGELRDFLCRAASALPQPNDDRSAFIWLSATPDSVTVSEAYRHICLRINDRYCFRTSIVVEAPCGTGKNFPFLPSPGVRFYDTAGEPVGKSELSSALAMHAIQSLLAVIRD